MKGVRFVKRQQKTNLLSDESPEISCRSKAALIRFQDTWQRRFYLRFLAERNRQAYLKISIHRSALRVPLPCTQHWYGCECSEPSWEIYGRYPCTLSVRIACNAFTVPASGIRRTQCRDLTTEPRRRILQTKTAAQSSITQCSAKAIILLISQGLFCKLGEPLHLYFHPVRRVKLFL